MEYNKYARAYKEVFEIIKCFPKNEYDRIPEINNSHIEPKRVE